jgi:hypothetical protein
MPGDTDHRESKKTQRATRRHVLATMVGAGVSGMLAEEVHALTAGQKKTFIADVNAFNNLASYYNNQSASPLWQLLDPNVVVLNVSTDTGKATSISEAMTYFFGLVVLLNNKLTGPTFNPFGPPPAAPSPYKSYGPPNYTLTNKVRGTALWIDTDGSSNDVIPYTFTFNGNLIVRMRARSE